ncbi:hypothetical protein [Catalinimonas alkaloidigena]|uniref:hypothetical protein n=1 Tax=Catalinimonas alkaloidigena TaxID=1075417 RepID=UPI0024064735|nr:hypothetical protein [Catalinimonas alkaloidigena]
MKNIFFILFCIAIIFASGCANDDYDPLGDLIVNLLNSTSLPDNPLIEEVEVGIFPTESLLTDEFIPALAFKKARVELDVDEDEVPTAVITNILPGTYVLALISISSSKDTPKQVIQITADDVTVTDLKF